MPRYSCNCFKCRGHHDSELVPDDDGNQIYYTRSGIRRSKYGGGPDLIPEREMSRKWSDGWNCMVRVLNDIASYGSATGSAIIIEGYQPHTFRPPERLLIIEEQSFGIWGLCVRHFQRLLEQFQLESAISRRGKTVDFDRTGSRASLKSLISQISGMLEKLQIFQILSDPPPLLFLAACIIFSLAIGGLWESQRRNQYRAWIFGFGMTMGIFETLRTGKILQDGKGYLAWSAIFGLALSSLVHGVMRIWWKTTKLEKDEGRFAKCLVDGYEEKKVGGLDDDTANKGSLQRREGATKNAVAN